MDCDFFYKIVLVGDSGTGKSEMLLSYAGNRLDKESGSVEANFKTKTLEIDGKIVTAQIWDLSGKEKFRGKTRGYCRFAEGAMILYSITDHSTFDSAKNWLKEIKECHAHPGITIMLIGTHLNMSHNRAVTRHEAKKYADKEKLQFTEISANDPTNVNVTFLALITDIHHTFQAKRSFIGSAEPAECKTSKRSGSSFAERRRSFTISNFWAWMNSKPVTESIEEEHGQPNMMRRRSRSDSYHCLADAVLRHTNMTKDFIQTDESRNDDKKNHTEAVDTQLCMGEGTLATTSGKQLMHKSEKSLKHKDSFENIEKENEQLTMQLKKERQYQQQLEEHIVHLSGEIRSLNHQLSVLEHASADTSWKVSHKEVMVTKEELGRGGWGVIWIGQFREQRVAVKQMHDTIASQVNLDLLYREISTMAQLHHPNLLQFIGAVIDHPSGNPMIITEIMDMSLRKAYEDQLLTPSQQSECVAIMRDVAVGLNYLHCLPEPIIHRDVSSANVLLESKGRGKWKTKISDFGSANKAKLAVTGAVGAVLYSAPEALRTVASTGKKSQTTKMDIFSYGVLLCEILNCKFPDVDSFLHLQQQVRIKSTLLYHLIGTCVQESPDSRPTLEEVIKQLDSL